MIITVYQRKIGSVNILMGLFKKQTTHKKIKRALL